MKKGIKTLLAVGLSVGAIASLAACKDKMKDQLILLKLQLILVVQRLLKK